MPGDKHLINHFQLLPHTGWNVSQPRKQVYQIHEDKQGHHRHPLYYCMTIVFPGEFLHLECWVRCSQGLCKKQPTGVGFLHTAFLNVFQM